MRRSKFPFQDLPSDCQWQNLITPLGIKRRLPPPVQSWFQSLPIFFFHQLDLRYQVHFHHLILHHQLSVISLASVSPSFIINSTYIIDILLSSTTFYHQLGLHHQPSFCHHIFHHSSHHVRTFTHSTPSHLFNPLQRHNVCSGEPQQQHRVVQHPQRCTKHHRGVGRQLLAQSRSQHR